MAPIRANGADGRVSFDGHYVTITRTGPSARGSKGLRERRIPVSLISAVHWKPPSLVRNGFIGFETFSVLGPSPQQGMQGPYAAWHENVVTVKKMRKSKFLALRDAVETARVSLSRKGPGPSSGEIARLTELHAAGHLTDTEFTDGIAQTLGFEPPPASD